MRRHSSRDSIVHATGIDRVKYCIIDGVDANRGATINQKDKFGRGFLELSGGTNNNRSGGSILV